MSVTVKERPAIIKKKEIVKELTNLINEYDIIGIVQMENLGSRQLQGIKKKLKGKAIIKMAKNSLMRRAIVNSRRPGIDKLEKHIQGSCAFIFTKMG
ncbi:MAG: 50S ribosomal protein L10, partial [Candidatus Odinarchaeia archaeon]